MGADPISVSALILAGGRASRFGGVAKHLLVVDGETIFARLVGILRPRVAEILVSARDDVAGFHAVHDAHEGVGPLAGIAAGLTACTTEWLLVVAGDMPYLTGALIDRLIAARGDDGVMIESGGLPEPLVCLLHTRVRPVVEQRIVQARFKASALLTDAGLVLRRLDVPDRSAFRNINSPEDL